MPKLVMAGIWWMDADMTMPDTPIAMASCQNTRLLSACMVVYVTSLESALLRGVALPVRSPGSSGGAPSGSRP